MKAWVWWTIGGIAVTVTAVALVKRKEIMQAVWDLISEQRIQKLHPAIRDRARAFIAEAQKQGIFLRVVQGLRTWPEQQKIYDQGRTTASIAKGEKIVSWAKPGQSPHNYGLAIDVVEMKNGSALWETPNWQKIGNIGKSFGFEWGGDWQKEKLDRPHFEYPPGVPASKWLANYNAGKLDENGYLTQIT